MVDNRARDKPFSNQQVHSHQDSHAASELHLINIRIGEMAAITLSVATGECVAISGPSGSGKSRLLRIVADLDPGPGDVEGVLKLGQRDHLHFSGAQWRRRVAYLAAESQWWFDDVESHFIEQPAHDLLHRLGLNPALLTAPIRRLSTGERQRFALLRMLMHQPHVLLLDEPTASLDHGSALSVEQIIKDYRNDHQAAVIWVSHDAEQIARVADRHFSLQPSGLIELTGENDGGH